VPELLFLVNRNYKLLPFFFTLLYFFHLTVCPNTFGNYYIYTELKDYQKALSDYNKAISVNPELAMAYLGRGKIYYRLNQPQKAKNNWQKSAELYNDPSSSGYGQYRGQESTLEETIDELQQGAQQAQKENDLESYQANKAALKQFQIFYYVDQAEESLLIDEDKQKAIEFLTKVIAIDPKYTQAYFDRSSVYKDLNNYPKAIADYNQLIAIEPQSARIYRARGQAYKDISNYPKAIADYKKAIEIEPKGVWQYLDLAKFYIDLKDYQSAILTYNKAIALEPDSDIYNFRARVHLAIKDYPKAIADYTKTIENHPENERSYLNRGQAYFSLKKYNLAIADFTKAIEDYPEYTDAYYNRSVTHTFLKDYPAAIKDLTKAIEICNKDELDNCTNDKPSLTQITIAQLHLDRSVNYFILKQYSKALVDLNKVVLLEPKNPDAYLQRGSAYYSLKDKRQAREDWQTAAKLYKQQGNFELKLTQLQNQAQAEKQKGNLELYRKVQQVIEIFEQFH
jgi:tetratricopeptide (TPR) repeat protein